MVLQKHTDGLNNYTTVSLGYHQAQKRGTFYYATSLIVQCCKLFVILGLSVSEFTITLVHDIFNEREETLCKY